MTIITLKLTEIKTETTERPKECPYCKKETFQYWGKVEKPVRDPKIERVEVRRYRCCGCGKTFRHYPQGIEAADQSQRMVQLAAICWRMGLSLRGVSGVLGVFGRSLCHMSVWRDVQAMGQPKKKDHKVRVLGIDGFYTQVKGKDTGVMVAVDMGNGQPVALAKVDEHNLEAVLEWLRPLVEELGVEVIVSDDLEVFDQIAKILDRPHQVCRFHFLRWVLRALRELEALLGEEWRDTLDEIRRLVRTMPPQAKHWLYLLSKRIHLPKGKRSPSTDAQYRLWLLVHRLSENWERYTLFLNAQHIPATNNRTEQAIGHWRTRSKTARGFKSLPGLLAAFWVCN